MRMRPGYLSLLAALLIAAVLGRIAVGVAADITIMRAFFTSLDVGDVYSLRLRWTVWLALIGFAATLVLCAPVLRLGRAARGIAEPNPAQPSEEPGPLTEEEIARITRNLDPSDLTRTDAPPPAVVSRRDRTASRVSLGAFGVAVLLVGSVLVPGLASARDLLLAASKAVPFGVADPLFGNDVSFSVFTLPALVEILRLIAVGVFLSLCVGVITGAALWYIEAQQGAPGRAEAFRQRTISFAFVMGGALLVCIGVALWLSRYALLWGRGVEIAGPGAAMRAVDIPVRGIAGVAIIVLGLIVMAMSIGAVRRLDVLTRRGPATIAGLAFWAAVIIGFAIMSAWWWALLLVVLAAGGVQLYMAMPGRLRRAVIPQWVVPTFAGVSMLALALIGPLTAAIYDGLMLRGPQFQVEGKAITHTLEYTRRASGLDAAEVVESPYRTNGLSAAGISQNPATMASFRMADLSGALDACMRSELPGDTAAYKCDDVDIVRDVVDGRKRTVFTVGREIDYGRLNDFQRRHLGFTHGYGLLMAPVNELSPSGNPLWSARGIPQQGIDPPLRSPAIYFGAQESMPWALVNTRQPVLDGRSSSQPITDWCEGEEGAKQCGRDGGTGISVNGSWRRFAASTYLGGIPVAGEGRRIWNTFGGRLALPQSQLLLFRDIRERVKVLAPFLEVDNDPYFVAVQGRLWVVASAYVGTNRYPYSAEFNGVNYMRQPAMAAVDAHSGQTYIFTLDEDEPILATWRAVYPSLFTPLDKMDEVAPGLRDHMRYGEGVFDYQAAAAGRFHVRDPELLANNTEAWEPGLQKVGALDGQERLATGRYGFIRLPGSADEQFAVLRTFTPPIRGSDVRFAGWIAASSDPKSFGALTMVRFRGEGEDGPGSLLGFTGRIDQEAQLSQELRLQTSPFRGEAMVAPVGDGLLYVLPIYLRSGSAPPSIFRVVVWDGAGRVTVGSSFQDALSRLTGSGGNTSPSGGRQQTPTQSTPGQLVRQARDALQSYNQANAQGNYAEAGRHLERLNRILAQIEARTDSE